MTNWRERGGGSRRQDARRDRPGGSQQLISEEDAIAIIDEGDAERLVKRAKAVAEDDALRDVRRTAVRRLFGEARRIELMWNQAAFAGLQADEKADVERVAGRRAALLEPRFAYQTARHPELRPLVNGLMPLMGRVQGSRERFGRFVEFFEALVAFLRKE